MAEETSKPAVGADAAKLRQHVRILADLGKLASEHQPLERLLDQAAVQVARAVEIDHVKIMHYRPQTSDLFMIAGIGWKEGVVRSATFPAGMRSPPGRTFQTAEPTVIEDLSVAKDFTTSDVLTAHGIVSVANVPVLIDGAAWGVLEVDSSTKRAFSEDTLDFMSAAAAIIGVALQGYSAQRSEAEAVAAAATGIQTREVLLREMQHRVKNNFQIILASISLQRRRFKSDEVHRALDHIANRISAVALAHDQLAPQQDIHAIDLARYLRTLCSSIEQQVDNISIDVETDEIELGIDRAIPLGLIVNEAVTNSVKHAFHEKGGKITVRLSAGIGYGEARLVVADNGKGMPESRHNGTGLTLISSLARQIGAEVDQQSTAGGTATAVTFPVIV